MNLTINIPIPISPSLAPHVYALLGLLPAAPADSDAAPAETAEPAKAPKTPKAQKAPKAAAKAEEPSLSPGDLQAMLGKAVEVLGAAKIKAIFEAQGAKKFSELKPASYQLVADALDAALAEKEALS